MEKIFEGPVWVGRDNLVTYDIISQDRKNEMLGSNDPEVAGQFTFENIDPEFVSKAKAGEIQIVVAGTNFGGGGKSIELPVKALQGDNIKMVVAEGYGRFFYRNAINNAFPVMTCAGITKDFIKTGEHIRVELTTGKITNLDTGKTIMGDLLTPEALAILEAGGFIEYTKRRLAKGK
ncbi:MAG: 3-isopropylmalate dehydratase small subunit [Firmicutes bacterium]|jgi:3-isopropylmalate/(R)-2-methylmalate dehydratase small subunit|nr:3-isopropylmalate dehydratase small subunit [Bacillota bacterium]MBR0210097.1 3-isopropylmalate dehydratase small subunit [Bacillota bacterium]MBR6969406.1 3-isopropylmalate dehydratase small subunit [Bacillota bacterium]